MSRKVYITAAGHLSSMGLVAGVWALVNATANTKYVCEGTSDAYVSTARWLDIGQFCTAFATVCLVLYRQLRSEPDKPDLQLAVLVEVFGGVTALVFLTTVITTASVCSSNRCITSDAASDAMHGVDTDLFTRQVDHMIGLQTAKTTSTYTCNGHLDPWTFQSPSNYCESFIRGECGNSAGVITSERCLVFACSNLVPGDVARYTISMICMVLQMLAAAAMVVHERNLEPTGGNQPDAANGPDTMGQHTAQPAVAAALPEGINAHGDPRAGALRQRRTRGNIYYSSVSSNIDF